MDRYVREPLASIEARRQKQYNWTLSGCQASFVWHGECVNLYMKISTLLLSIWKI